ncbi:MAG: heme-binding protein, partial [Acidobacteriota bacterium]
AAAQPALTKDDVQRVIESAAKAVDSNSMVIAVTDRQGDVLAVFRKPGAPETAIGNFSKVVDANELAVALARTAGFFSNGQAPLSSRTVRFISGVHFPPGILYTGSAALYGIENTNRGCLVVADYAPGKLIQGARSIDGSTMGLGIITGKKDLFDSDPTAVNPGGVPLYKDGEVVGGVGVTGVGPDLAEYAAFIGSATAGFAPTTIAAPGVVFIDGIALPFVDNTSAPGGIGLGRLEGTYVMDPRAAPGPAPEGDVIIPRAGPVGGLTAQEVRQIVDRAIETANDTRAIIRLPLGSKARMVIAVADLDGQILALHRMDDATFFSVDVALAKSRNVIYFSSQNRVPSDLPGVPLGTAVTNRTLGYGGQPFFPIGLDFTDPGPFFDLFKKDVENPCTQGSQPANGRQNGIVFFPGALPLYRNGVLIGGLGVSGDGVEQDDFVTAGGAKGFEPPTKIRADRVFIDGVRLPYIKFPRNPTQ